MHAFYRACGTTNGASCNCAVSIQSGDDVIVIDQCGPTKPLTKQERDTKRQRVHLYLNGELTPGTQVRKLRGGKTYQVTLPNGIKVEVKKVKIKGNSFLDLHITGTATDREKVHGEYIATLYRSLSIATRGFSMKYFCCKF